MENNKAKKKFININESNFEEHLNEFFIQKYYNQFLQSIEEYPYELENILDEESKTIEQQNWFIFQKTQSETGKTIAQEFAEKFIFEPELKTKISKLNQIIASDFEITDIQQNTIVLLDIYSGKKYNVENLKENKSFWKIGKRLKGKIHPWGKKFRLTGIFLIELTSKEVELIENQNSTEQSKKP